MKATPSLLVLAGAVLLATARTPRPKGAEEPSGSRRLKIVETVALRRNESGSTLPPEKCDGEGNVYVRFYHGSSTLKEPVYKFDQKGEQRGKYSVASNSEFQTRGAGVLDFAIGKHGEVYQLAISEKGAYIIRHNTDGRIKSKAKLDTDFFPHHFAVFDSGQFLITGVGFESAANLEPHSIYTAIFDERGRLSKKIILPEDKIYEDAADRGDAESIEVGGGGGGNYAVEWGQVTRGSDGNLYVVRWTNPAKVYAIASSGEVVRSFEVKPDWDGRKPDGAYIHDGRLALLYAARQDDRRSMIKVVAIDGGEVEAAYDISGVGTLACYGEPERFTLFAGQRLVFAEPQHSTQADK